MAKTKTDEQPKSNDEKIRALEQKFGIGIGGRNELRVVSTGSYKLDAATGIGGYPLGKIIETFGPESAGKSTLTLHAIAQFQRAFPEKKVALFDYEHSWDKKYSQAIGVDNDALLVYQPDYQEQGYDLLENLVGQELISLAVLDSQTAAIPRAIIEGEMGDATMALQARNNSKFCGKIKGKLDRSGATLLVISQTRANIGGMGHTGDIPTGGNAWKFYADMRFKVWKLLDKPNELNKTTIDVIKNKCASPFGQAVIDINWGIGIDNYGEVIDFCLEKKVIKLAGSWYSYGTDKLGQGRDSVKQLLHDNPELYSELKEKALSNEEPKEEIFININ